MGFRSRRKKRKDKIKRVYGLKFTQVIEDELAAMDARPAIIGNGLPERGESEPLAVAGEYIAAGSTVQIELGTPGNAFVYASRDATSPLPLHLPGMAIEISPVSNGEVIIARGHEDPDGPAIRRASQRWGTDASIVRGGS